jgi:hypothetical protein
MSRAKEWKTRARETARSEAVELVLPSGMEILARRPDPLQLAAWGRLPLGLVGAAVPTAAGEITTAEVAETAAFMRDLLTYCCVDPAVSVEPGEDTMHPSEIPQQDWTFILRWALRAEEVRALDGFRQERANHGAAGGGEGVGRETERAASDE